MTHTPDYIVIHQVTLLYNHNKTNNLYTDIVDIRLTFLTKFNPLRAVWAPN